MIKNRIIDLIRGTNVVLQYNQYKNLFNYKNYDFIELQKRNLTTFLIELKKNPFYYNYLSRFSDKDISNYPYQIHDILPITSKEIINKHFKSLLIKGNRSYEYKYTGGSSGKPFHFILDKKSISHTIAFNYFLWNYFLNYELGQEIIVISGSSLGQSRYLNKTIYNFLQNKKFIPGDKITISNANRLKTYITKNKKGLYIYAYPSTLIAYTELIKNSEIPLKKVKGIITTSEMLSDKNKDYLEQYFQTKVLNVYGANDGGIMSGSIDNKTFLYNGMDCFVENKLINGFHEILLTNLHSFHFPFVKYRVEDLADIKLNNEGYPFIINNLLGRSRDILYTENKEKVHGVIVNNILKKLSTNCQYQIIQNADLSCNLYIKRKNILLKEDFKKVFITEMKKVLGNIDISILEGDDFIKNKNGKHKLIISNVP